MKKIKIRIQVVSKKFIICLIMLFGVSVPAQNKPNLRYTIDSHASGNIHGTIYSAGCKLESKRHGIEISALWQKRGFSFSGVKLGYEFMIIGPMFENSITYANQNTYNNPDEPKNIYNLNGIYDDKWHMGIICFTQYLNKAKLSYNSQKVEEHVNRIEGYNWGTSRMNTFDLGIGIQIKREISDLILLRTYLASTFVYHTNYINNMHHQNLMTTLTIGVGLEFHK